MPDFSAAAPLLSRSSRTKSGAETPESYDRQMPNSIPAIQLPTGGTLRGFASPELPLTQCATVSNLMTQVVPLVASMDCQLKVLMLLKPLIEVINGLPSPPLKALQQFAEAAVALEPCLLAPTPASVIPFVRDLLCLEIKSLNCLLRQLQNVAALGSELSPYSTSQVEGILDSYVPIVGILELADAFFGIAGMNIPSPPTLGRGTDPDSIREDQRKIVAFTAALQSVADALGGCG